MGNRTYTMIKPECVQKGQAGAMIARIQKGGYKILAMRMVQMTLPQAKAFYAVHKERPFYGELTEYMTGGPIVALVLEKKNCVKDYRDFIGATNPSEAAAGTLRADFGTSIQNNAIHASDSDENAAVEIGFFFSTVDLVG